MQTFDQKNYFHCLSFFVERAHNCIQSHTKSHQVLAEPPSQLWEQVQVLTEKCQVLTEKQFKAVTEKQLQALIAKQNQ